MGGWDGEAGEDKAALAAAPAGAAMTPAGSPLPPQSADKDSFVPKREVRKPALAATASAQAVTVKWHNQVTELKKPNKNHRMRKLKYTHQLGNPVSPWAPNSLQGCRTAGPLQRCCSVGSGRTEVPDFNAPFWYQVQGVSAGL